MQCFEGFATSFASTAPLSLITIIVPMFPFSFFLTAELTEHSDDRMLTKPLYVPGWLIGSILSSLAFDVTFSLSSLSTP